MKFWVIWSFLMALLFAVTGHAADALVTSDTDALGEIFALLASLKGATPSVIVGTIVQAIMIVLNKTVWVDGVLGKWKALVVTVLTFIGVAVSSALAPEGFNVMAVLKDASTLTLVQMLIHLFILKKKDPAVG